MITGGNWKYGRTLTHGLAVFASNEVGSPDHIVAVCDDNVDNARLIAAAPEMLVALEDVIFSVQKNQPVQDWIFKVQKMVEIAKGIRHV